MAKTYIHDMQMPLYSEDLNYAEVAQMAKTHIHAHANAAL